MSQIEAGDDVENNLQRELSIKDEYQLWRKNCRYMYEFVNETALMWPSLTIQWLPEHTNNEDGTIDAKLLLGTHTSGEDTNYLKIASTQLPGSAKKANSRIRIIKKYKNAFEINRARYQPQDPSIIATINGEGKVDIYDLKTDNNAIEHFEPHKANGYGLSWNNETPNQLLTCSDDGSVVITDVSFGKEVFRNEDTHKDTVNDSKWLDSNVFGSVSDDKYLYLFDARTNTSIAKYYSEDSNGINSLAFSPFLKNLVAIGNTNANIGLLDIRKISQTEGLLHTMMGHSDSITCLEFSPHRDGILSSGSQDRRLIIWDLFKIGEEQQQEDAEDGCPELFMMHAGHTGAVSDLSWCPFQDWTVGSVADDNIVHLWEMSKGLLNAEKSSDIRNDTLE